MQVHEPLTAAELRAGAEVVAALLRASEPGSGLEPAVVRSMLILARVLSAMLQNMPREEMAETAIAAFYDGLRLFLTLTEEVH